MNTKELQLYLLGNYPFYYALLQQCKINFDEKIQGIAEVKISTRLEMTINPDKFKEFTIAEQAGVLIHELQHIYKDHIKQTLMHQVDTISEKLGVETNMFAANIAMDLEINPGIYELSTSKKLGLNAKNGSQFRGVYPVDFKFSNGDSWPNYFAKLKGKYPPKPKNGQGKGDGTPHQGHDYFKGSTKDVKLMDEIAANAAKKAKCLSAGQTPREIEKYLLEYEANQQIPWYLVLRQFMQSLVDIKTRNTWKKVNRRFRGKLPGAKHIPKIDLLIGIDSSGSMSDENLKAVYNEVESINNTGIVNIEIAVFDTTIHQQEEYKKGFEAKRVCSGGTSFIPVHELAIKDRYKGVIYLTDGYAEFPDPKEVNYKCLWVINNDHVKPPYGSTVRIK